MAGFQNLPSDILFDIIVKLSTLQELWLTVSSCQQLYHTFDQCRSLVLQQVFNNQFNTDENWQVSQGRGAVEKRTNHIRAQIGAARAIVDRCKTTPGDALCLHAAAWSVFLGFRRHLWLDCLWGQRLIERYVTADEHSLALNCAKDLWKSLLAGPADGRKGLHHNNLQSCQQGVIHITLAQTLVTMCLKAGQPEEAIGVLRTCYEVGSRSTKSDNLSIVMRSLGKSNELIDVHLLPFFHECVARAKTEILAGGRSSLAQRRIETLLDLLPCSYLVRAGKHSEAIEAMRAVLDLALSNAPNMSIPVGLGRRLVKMLYEQSRYEDGLALRRTILDALHAQSTLVECTSLSRAWTKEYTADLRLLGWQEEALHMEERLWEQLKAQLNLRVDDLRLYHARNAAWTLANSYLELSDADKADKVRWDYESIRSTRKSQSRIVPQMLWPGTSLPLEAVVSKAQLDLPNMVSEGRTTRSTHATREPVTCLESAI